MPDPPEMTALQEPGAAPTSGESAGRSLPGRGEIRARLLAVHAVAVRFYRAQLDSENGASPSAFLERRGVPVGGPWVVGYAPNRQAALIKELRRHGFSDIEIRASGLAQTSPSGMLIDRFRDRVVIGLRDANDPDAPVVAFAGYAPPRAPPDVVPLLYSPATAIHRPDSTLFGVVEQPSRTRASIVANDPLEGIVISTRTASAQAPPLVVAPGGPQLTRRHVAALSRAADVAAGVTVIVRDDDAGSGAAARAYALLSRIVRSTPEQPRKLLAARRFRDLSDPRPLAESVVTERLDSVEPGAVSGADRSAIARSAEELIAGEPPDIQAELRELIAQRLGLPPGELAMGDKPEPAKDPTSPHAEAAMDQAPDPTDEQLLLDVDGAGQEAEVEDAGVFGLDLTRAVEASPPVVVPDEPVGDPAPPPAALQPPMAADEGQVPAVPAPVAEAEPATAEPDANVHTLPDRAEPVEGVEGYHYTHRRQEITVYGPDNAPVATARYLDGGITVGEVEGVRIPSNGWGSSDFHVLAARQHRTAHAPTDQRDRVRVEIVPDSNARAGYVVTVYGTVKGDALDGQAIKDGGHFLWSSMKKAWVSGRKWTPAKVDENFGCVLREFARQGRNVLVSNADIGREQSPETASTPAAPPPSTVADEVQVTRDTAEAPELRADPEPVAEPAAAEAEAKVHTLPDDAEPVEGVDGYHYAFRDGGVMVYGPDSAPVATAKYAGGGMAGEVEGVRFSVYLTSEFAPLAARQHRAARLPPEQRDRVSVEIVPDKTARTGYVTEVHGTVKHNDRDVEAVKGAGHFLWSGKKKAWVSGRQWTPAKVDENFGRMMREFARQGRNVLVTNAETGREQTAEPSTTGAPAPVAPEQPPVKSLATADPKSLTDEELVNAITSAEARGGYQASYGYLRDQAAGARADALKEERADRVLKPIAEAPEVGGMSDEQLAAEQKWLISELVRTAFTYGSENADTVKARGNAVKAEVSAREVRSLLTDPPALEGLSAEALKKAFDRAVHLGLDLRSSRPEEYEAIQQRRQELLDELAARRVRYYEDRRDVADLTLEELAAESADLERLSEEYPVHDVDAVNAARRARIEAVDAEIDRLEAARFPNELPRAKVDRLGHVTIDGMPESYGDVRAVPGEAGGGFEAKVGNNNLVGHFVSRPAAIAALVRHYDQDSTTLSNRRWGVPCTVALPLRIRDELVEWLGDRSGAGASLEHKHLAQILSHVPTRQPDINPLTRESMHVYEYSVEEGLLDELGRICERVTTELRERAANPDVLKKEREAAKRRVPLMGVALHNINVLRRFAQAEGRDTDRKVLDESQVAAQLAALAADVDSSDGGSSESIQPDRQTPLGAVPAQGTGHDGGSRDVLRGEGSGVASGGDRAAGGARGDPPAGDGLPGARGSAESDSRDRGATGDDGAAAAAGGGGTEPLARFRPNPADTPRTPLARAAANLEAVEVLRRLEQDGRGATADEQRILSRWSGWGSVPVVFLDRPDKHNPAYGEGPDRKRRYEQDLKRWEEYSRVRDRLRELLDPFEWTTASRSTLSAHYTPQSLAEAMWDGLLAFGFDGGEVLEAGSGSGAFFGAAPDIDSVRLTGVEVDPNTGRICQFIYPHANVLIESFADTDAPRGTFDAAIGNVPFAHVPFADGRYGAAGHSLHNGFLIKELALVREGGFVMAVTSRWTLDSENDAARREMTRYGDLVAAYRLPAGVFAESAGTDVVVDVLVFRRGAEGQTRADPVWLNAPKRKINGGEHTINAYFAEHPKHVLGKLTTASGPFGPAVVVEGDPTRAVQDLRDALLLTAELAKAGGRAYEPHPEGADREPLNLQTAREKHATDYTGRLYVDEDRRIWQHVNGGDPIEAVPSDGNTAQLLALLELRDAATELKQLDRTGNERQRSEEVRARVRRLHTAYTSTYGPLSRPGQSRLAQAPGVRARARAEGRPVRDHERTLTAWGWFREDPDAGVVLALEWWDRQHEAAIPSEVLTQRPGTRRVELQRTDDPQVALSAVVGATGHVDLERIAGLLGTNPDEARRRLGTEVFDNPTTGKLEHAGAYLSGAVHRKLDDARAAAAADPAYAVNVAALEAVQPRQRRIGQFTPQLGAHWIPPALVQGFLREYLGDPTVQVHHNDRYGWTLHAGYVPDAVNALKGSAGRSALQIARAILGHGSLVVGETVEQPGGKLVRVVNEDASRSARQKADLMRSAFEEYLTADSNRVKDLTEAYNRLMNGHVVRNYDGLAPTLAGFTEQRTPHSHQLAGAARMQFERGVILAHEAGLGKTTTMILGTQALKASEQINKPFAVVQRHLAQQWLDEARFLYPNADIRLITSDMVSGDQRRRTLEWLRSNTPDLTILTEAAFTSVKMSPEYQEWYEFRELENLREQILRERGVPDNALAVRKLEERLATKEAKLRRNSAPMRTPGELYWEDLGFDYGLIDELHRFKGVGFRSKEGGGSAANIRAVDLHQKLTHMHREADAMGGRPTVTGGTGTPLTNSISEQYTMLALISPWVLEEFGVQGADLWAETFGQKVQRIEMAPDGSGLKVVERFSRFISKATMKTMWGLTVDTKTAEAVGIERPAVAGGGPQLHLVGPTPDQRARLKALIVRGAAIHAGEVSRFEDNMLAVAGEGRGIALDPRLVDPNAPAGRKLAEVADWFASRYHANKDRVYALSRENPTPHPVRGALQIGFLNQGTPGGSNKGNFNAYATLRDLCVERGVPAEKIAFVQEHNQNQEKLTELYRKCREGGVAIILASTETMGTGANIQNRAISLAHIDLDWTPAGMEQRDKRIVRWGNQNEEVEIAIFALEGSMDAWQAALLDAKAEGLRDIQRPEITDEGDVVQEIGEVEWDFATMQAEIGGNPYMGQLMKARMHLADLEADRRNQAADRLRQAELLDQKTKEAAATREAIARRDEVLPIIELPDGDDLEIEVDGARYTQRESAARELRAAVNTALVHQGTAGIAGSRILGRLGGLPFGVRSGRNAEGELQAQVGFPDLRHSEALYKLGDLTKRGAGGSILSRLTAALEKAPDQQLLDRRRLPGLDEEIALLTEQKTATDFSARIAHAQRRVELLDEVVAAIAERDKFPELTAEDLNPEKYRTDEQRERAISARAEERRPLQAKVDSAIAQLEAFDRESAGLEHSVEPELEGAPGDGTTATAGPFGAVEHARIRSAVEDHAARYFGGPFQFGRDSAARYVSEGHLRDLVERHGLRDVWDAVAAHIEAHPELLERTEAERDAARTARSEEAAAVNRDAVAAYKAGDLNRASELVDAAELIDPDHPGDTWNRARQAIEKRRAKGRDGEARAAETQEATAARSPRERPVVGAAADGPGVDPF